MRIYGLDFTSAPGRSKPLIVLGCKLAGGSLRVEDSETLTDFGGFEEFLQTARALGVRDGLPFRPAEIPRCRTRLARELGRLRRRGRRALEGGVRGCDPGRHGYEAAWQQVALQARRPQERVQQRDDALPGARREDVLPGRATPPRLRRPRRAMPPQRGRARGSRGLPRRRRPPLPGPREPTSGTPSQTRPREGPRGRR